MAEWKRISPLDIVWQGFGRVCVGGGEEGQHGGCRKVQGEHKWGNEGGEGGREEDGCRSVPSDNGVLLVVVVGQRVGT